MRAGKLRRAGALLAVAGAVLAGSARPVVAASARSGPGPTAVAGAPGAGDPYFPTLGNGGYDALHYDVSLSYDLPSNALLGDVALRARATQDLRSFTLDLATMRVRSVTIDGQPVALAQPADKLLVVPGRPLRHGHVFAVEVRYGGIPKPIFDGSGFPVGWFPTPNNAFVLSEPGGAHGVFPSNDHPSDKATFTFRITTRDPLSSIANGRLVGSRRAGPGRTTRVFDEREQMATYLAQVVVGRLDVVARRGPDGTLLRDASSPGLTAPLRRFGAMEAPLLRFFSARFGRYPFSTYGVVVPDGWNVPIALETQTLAIFPTTLTAESDPLGSATFFAHELVHQWFGDAVSVARWRDIWLNEGFATFGEWLWGEHIGGPTVAAQARREAAFHPEELTGPGTLADPGVTHMFDRMVYVRGGMALQALRETVGDRVFFRILSTYFHRYDGGNASTRDFERVAESVSHRSLGAFFHAWLDSHPLPSLPPSPPA